MRLLEPKHVVMRMYAALGDDDPVARDFLGQTLADVERDGKVVQIAVVDSDETRLERERALQLLLVVHFDQHVHAQIMRGGVERLCGVVVNGGHDDEDAVGAEGARLVDLIGVVEKILAQGGKMRRLAGGLEVFELALEGGPVGEHGQTRGAGGLIGAGEFRRIEMFADHAFRRARLLDFGDERDAAFAELVFDGVHEAARRIVIAHISLQRGERHAHLGLGDFGALIGFDFIENIGHVSCLGRARRASRRLRGQSIAD